MTPFRDLASPANTPPARGGATEPLLTLAIPTWNRAAFLEPLFAVLLSQAEWFRSGVVELLVADNGSTDGTPELIARYIAAGLPIRLLRHPANIGSDANFISCYENARGRYFWLCGDDDIPTPPREGYPGALGDLIGHLEHGDFDLIYMTSYGFRTDWQAERESDPMGREFHIIPGAQDMMRVVNILFTFVSGIVVRRERLEALRLEHPEIEPPSAFAGTNLTQLSWTLPLLRFHERSLVLWRRPVACFTEGRGGYSFGLVFGERLVRVVRRTLPGRPHLQGLFLNATIRRYLPSALLGIRQNSPDLGLAEAGTILRQVYGRNWRFWIFAWPVLRLPLRWAGPWQRAGAAVNKLLYALAVPRFWRRRN